MTGNTINTKSEALELHELSSDKLDAVSGGATKEDRRIQLENKQQLDAMKTFRQVLDSL